MRYIDYSTLTSGTIIRVETYDDMQIIHNAASLAATLEIELPNEPVDGQRIFITSSLGITALTLSSIKTIIGAKTGLTPNGTAQYIFSLRSDMWHINEAFTLTNSAQFSQTLYPGSEVNSVGVMSSTNGLYSRVGNIITVSGGFTFRASVTAIKTSFEIYLPIASNFATPSNLSGIAFCGDVASMGAVITAQATNKTAKVEWMATNTLSNPWSFNYQYIII